MGLPAYVGDLARIEWSVHVQKNNTTLPIVPVAKTAANPSLTILPVNWRHLPSLMRPEQERTVPQRQPTHVMVWRHPTSRRLHYREAADIDLLALKLIIEDIDLKKAAALGKATPGELKLAIEHAIAEGLLVAAASRIRRPAPIRANADACLETMLAADLFTLQWHITQACDLHCRHCYDRSNRTAMSIDTALALLDDFHDFCAQLSVRGQVTFTGGNPFLYPHFETVYQAASQWGFGIAILGNPAPRQQLRRLVDMAKPLYVQISLEGLQTHNDYMRGEGHFKRSLAFLGDLRKLGIFSMVMLTLTRDNIDQVIPLADRLAGLADQFTFNRLATVGEGAALQMPDENRFKQFLREYADKAATSPHMGLKDNLFNIMRHSNGQAPLGGCTGYGCGAAFNFMAVLPDGEVHACRKFPSRIGSIQAQRLAEIYNSELAQRYRAGSDACGRCILNLACRGCPAITHSLGLDVFSDKDPYCFASEAMITGRASPVQR